MLSIKKIKLLLVALSAVLLSACNNVKTDVATSSEVTETVIETTYEEDKVVKPLTGDIVSKNQYPLPKDDEVISGFKNIGIYDYYERDANLVIFEHEKSGAHAMLISNADPDKSFTLAYNTLAKDNKGKPHVFEHATISGGKMYPSKNAFFEAAHQTYNTYLNASTYQQVTMYPIGSLSDEQLFSLGKYYLDGTFDPNVLHEQKIVDKEAYRYYIDDDNKLKVTGAVYNEMLANSSNIEVAAIENAISVLYDDNSMGTNSGGNPEDVRTLTLDELVEFHDEYYHPSNLVIVLYGDLDYRKYLEYIDTNYLKNYDKITIDKSDDYTVHTEFKQVNMDFPVASGSKIEKGSVFNYCIVMPDMSRYDLGILNVLYNYLYRLESPLQRKILERLPEAGVSIIDNTDMPVPSYLFRFNNVDEKDGDTIKTIMEETFEELKNEGIPESIINMVVNDNLLNIEFLRDSHGFIENADCYRFIVNYYNTEKEGGLGQLEYLKGERDILKRYKDGTLDRLLASIADNLDSAVLVGTIPREGLLEKKDAENEKFLADKLDSMTEEEKEALKKANEEYLSWLDDDTENGIKDIKVASVSSLPMSVTKKQAYEENQQGVRFITSNIDDILYDDIKILFDAQVVEYKDLLKLSLLSFILNDLPTTNYTAEKLDTEIATRCYNYGMGLTNVEYDGGGYKPYFAFEFICLNKNIDKMLELYKERIMNTKFTDLEKLRNKASYYATRIKQIVNDDPVEMCFSQMEAILDESRAYRNYMDGEKAYTYFNEVANMSDEELTLLYEDIKNIFNKIINLDGMVCEIITDADNLTDIKKKVLDIANELPDENYDRYDYKNELKTSSNRLAIAVDGTSQYNVIGINLDENNLEMTGKLRVLNSLLRSEVLYPEFRFKNGVYGAGTKSDEKVLSYYTYRDPNISKSYDIYRQVPELFDNIKMTPELLENYKLNTYAIYSYPKTKHEASLLAIKETLSETYEKYYDKDVRYMQEIKDTTFDDIASLSEIIKKVVNSDKYVTVGGKLNIEKEKDLFDEIIYDYIK